MKIVIAGAGEVGTHLAKLLSHEEQDIILIDTDQAKLEMIDSNYNLMTVVGSPSSIHTLKEANITHADLFVAVTPHESQNIIAAMLAAQLGAKKTVARVDNYEYLLPENKTFFEKMGVHALIYPEMLAAEEIVASLRKTWARHWFELYNGELLLVGVRVRENALIVNYKLSDLTRVENFYHISAIKRKSETIIPRGNDTILADDIVFFSTTPDHLNDIRILCGKEDNKIRNVLIMGGSRIAVRTAESVPDTMKIKIIEQDKEKSYQLVEQLNNVSIVNGDGRDIELLLEEGIVNVDAFIALTDSSEINILSCLTAKRYGVKKTVAEVENLSIISTAEELNIGTVINKKLIAAGRIYQLLLDFDTANSKCFSLHNAEVIEMEAKEHSKITSAPVKKLTLPMNLTLGGLIRDGKGMVVTGETQIQAGDHVLVFCLDTAISKIKQLFY